MSSITIILFIFKVFSILTSFIIAIRFYRHTIKGPPGDNGPIGNGGARGDPGKDGALLNPSFEELYLLSIRDKIEPSKDISNLFGSCTNQSLSMGYSFFKDTGIRIKDITYTTTYPAGTSYYMIVTVSTGDTSEIQFLAYGKQANSTITFPLIIKGAYLDITNIDNVDVYFDLYILLSSQNGDSISRDDRYSISNDIPDHCMVYTKNTKGYSTRRQRGKRA